MGVPQNKAFRRENLTKMNDFGVPLFQETPIYIYIYKYKAYAREYPQKLFGKHMRCSSSMKYNVGPRNDSSLSWGLRLTPITHDGFNDTYNYSFHRRLQINKNVWGPRIVGS